MSSARAAATAHARAHRPCRGRRHRLAHAVHTAGRPVAGRVPRGRCTAAHIRHTPLGGSVAAAAERTGPAHVCRGFERGSGSGADPLLTRPPVLTAALNRLYLAERERAAVAAAVSGKKKKTARAAPGVPVATGRAVHRPQAADTAAAATPGAAAADDSVSIPTGAVAAAGSDALLAAPAAGDTQHDIVRCVRRCNTNSFCFIII